MAMAGAELAHEGHQGVHVVGVDRRGVDIGFADGRGHRIALALGAAGDHDLGEDIGILRQFVSHDGADTPAADQQYFAHVILLCLLYFVFLSRRYYLISHSQCPERTEFEKIVRRPNGCGSKNRAGRSLCPAEVRNSFRTRSRSPQAAARTRYSK